MTLDVKEGPQDTVALIAKEQGQAVHSARNPVRSTHRYDEHRQHGYGKVGRGGGATNQRADIVGFI